MCKCPNQQTNPQQYLHAKPPNPAKRRRRREAATKHVPRPLRDQWGPLKVVLKRMVLKWHKRSSDAKFNQSLLEIAVVSSHFRESKENTNGSRSKTHVTVFGLRHFTA